MRKLLGVISLIIFASFLLGLSSVSAKTYAWTDKNGKTQFTDYPPPPGQVMQIQPKRPSQRIYNDQKSSSPQKVNSPQVELYVTSWCPYCKKAIDYFESKGIRYKAYDIEKDKKAAKKKEKLDTRGGVPFAVINGQYIHGYVPELYGEALKKK